MKLLLLHGAGISSSRKKLSDLKKEFDPNNIVVFTQENSLEEINNNLAATPLFSTESLVVLENPPEDLTSYTLYPNPCTLIFWFDHEISDQKPIISYVKENRGEFFYFPESREISVFPFLDYLGNRDTRAFLELDKLKRGGFDIQYIITMVFYLLRNLEYTPKDAKDFIKKKNLKLRSNFSSEQLLRIYKSILEIDFQIKKGFLETEQAQFLLVNLFYK